MRMSTASALECWQRRARDTSMVQFSSSFYRSDSWKTEAGRAETTGIREPPSSTILPRTPTALLRRVMVKKITGPDTSFRNGRWNIQARHFSTHKKLTKYWENPLAKQVRRRAPHLSSEPIMLASEVRRKGNYRGAGTFFRFSSLASASPPIHFPACICFDLTTLTPTRNSS